MEESLFDIVPEGSASPLFLERLNSSDFDELIELDYIYDRYRFLCHAEGKYLVPKHNGLFSGFFPYSLEHMVHPEDRETLRSLMQPDTLLERLANADTPGILRKQLRYKLLGGGWRWVEQLVVGGAEFGFGEGLVRLYIFDLQDRASRRAALAPPAGSDWDGMTGLLRPKAFFAAVPAHMRSRSAWYILAVDIENFRLFNEWYGHESGDLLLAQIGEVLRQAEKDAGGLAAYLGQDDFCMLLPADDGVVKRIYEQLQRLIMTRGASVGFMPAFGLSAVGGEGSAKAALDRASIAASQVKGNFHSRIRHYDPAMQDQAEREYRLLTDFQRGLKNHEFFFYLQPQCLVPSGKVVGAESLARWRLPDGTMVPPDVFVPVLEKYGFVTDLDEYIWDGVCFWLHRWIRDGHTPVPVSVNVSQTDFFAIDVPEYIEQLIRKYDLPRELLKIEITESAYVNDADRVREAVSRLREKGFLILMDDFGSGYSSLNMLHKLNVDVIKLDAQFLRLSEVDEIKGIHILETIINMAKTMGVPIIVEGVETESQTRFLETLGCRYIQGYFYYRPMPLADFEKLVSDTDMLETGGISFLPNQQFSVREFMDENIYSDSMLNNILGAAAFYCWDGGENVDIVRFNEQFYRVANVPDFHERTSHIQQYFHPDDVPRFFGLLKAAEQDRMNGSSGVVGVYRTDGSLGRFLLHVYFLEETENGKTFYGAMQDVTEITSLQNQMRLLSEFSSESIIFLRRNAGRMSYQVAVHGLREVTGLDRDAFERALNDGSFYRSLDAGSAQRLLELSKRGLSKKSVGAPLRVKSGTGEPLKLYIKADYVHDAYGEVEYILVLRLLEET